MAKLSNILTARSSQGPSDNFKNIIINGAMQVAQRNTSVASITTSGYRTADRWNSDMSSLGTWTQSVENDAPTGSGFRKSLKMLATTADASPAASDYVYVNQILEGQNLQQVKKGTAAAEQLTVSFWVKSNVTGTYIVEFYDVDNTRQTSKSYTVLASGVWEYKTITFAADTTGAFDNDNAASLALQWWLGAGSSYTSGTLQSTWVSSTTANRAVGQVNLASATNNYWQITGVQLEVGDTATPFEFKPFAQDLRQCQRYYWKNTPTTAAYNPVSVGWALGTTVVATIVLNPVPMRIGATSVEFSSLSVGDSVNVGSAITGITLGNTGALANNIETTVSSGLTQYRPYGLRNNNNTAGYIAFSAEL